MSGALRGRHGSRPSDIGDRFWSHVRRSSGCWEWTGTCRDKLGYGVFSTTFYPRQKRDASHRIAWMLMRGDIPDGKMVCHSCDNPPCCNPDHLFIGTHQDNMNDMVNKGRSTKGMAARNRKIDSDAVLDIRSSKESCRALAMKYGISEQHAWKIRNRLKWAHVK